MIDEDRLAALMSDEAFEIPPAPDRMSEVDRLFRRMRRRRRTLLAGPLVVVLAATAATTLAMPGAGRDAIVTSSFGDLPDEPDPGIRASLADLRGDAALQAQAQETLVQQCMQQAGWRYDPTPVSTVLLGRAQDSPYGDDVSRAQRVGYDLPAVVTAEAGAAYGPDEALSRLDAAGRARYQAALFGPENARTVTVGAPWLGGTVAALGEGCLAQARGALFGDLTASLEAEFASSGPSAALAGSADDPERDRLDQRWRDCMSGTARAFDSPDAARAFARDGYERLPDDQARSQELAVATADARCEAETGYARARRQLEDRYLTALLTTYDGPAELARQALRTADTRAAQITAAPTQ